MLWVLKRAISLRSSFERPKQMLKLMGQKKSYNYTLNFVAYLDLKIIKRRKILQKKKPSHITKCTLLWLKVLPIIKFHISENQLYIDSTRY